MAAHFMTLPTELRLKVCEMVMASQTLFVVYLYWDDEESEMLVENDPERSRGDHRTPISLLLVCKTLHTEVSPIFHERVRLHLTSLCLETGEDLSGPEAEFIPFDVGNFLNVPKRVKTLSIETALAIQLARQYTSKDLRIGIESALPNLRQLIVYNTRNLEILCDDWNKKWKRGEVISEVEDMYDVDADAESAPLHRLTPCKGHKYILIQQVFFNDDEVCMATWPSSDHGFRYEFCRQEDAMAIVKPEDISGFW